MNFFEKFLGYWAHSQNCEKGLLGLSCLSVHPSILMEQLSSH